MIRRRFRGKKSPVANVIPVLLSVYIRIIKKKNISYVHEFTIYISCT
jgi:hypothetical protein